MAYMKKVGHPAVEMEDMTVFAASAAKARDVTDEPKTTPLAAAAHPQSKRTPHRFPRPLG
jgi:hypothetical protein